jgi:hypothetical protein
MARRGKSESQLGLRQAFDQMHFGPAKTLNLRASLPSAPDAVRRLENWLRERQAAGITEVLVITGRGNNSPGGISAVRDAVVAHFYSLRRRGVVAAQTEHTPGSFVVTLEPLREAIDAPRRRREPADRTPRADPDSLTALDPETRALLRDLAYRALEGLGIAETDRFVDSEMIRQFSVIAAGVPAGPERERRLRDAIRVALNQHE